MFLRATLLVSLSFVFGNEVSAGGSQLWYPTRIAISRLDDQNSKHVRTGSVVTCGIFVSRALGHYLFCYQDGLCLLSDLKVAGYLEEPSDDSGIACWTKYESDVPCEAPYSEVPDVGCVYLHLSPMTWDDARAFCNNSGNDLLVPDNFTAFRSWLYDATTKINVWVGARERSWLDGTEVEPSEWHSVEPNGAITDCGRMRLHSDEFYLSDTACSNSFVFICRQ